jgi:uncharacterized protein (TIGR02246 family)
MKKWYSYFAIIIASVFLTASCKKTENETSENEAPFDMVATKTAIETQGEVFTSALNKGDSIALAKCYTTDAKLLQPNGKAVAGRENIQKLFGQWIKSGMPSFSMKTIDVWGDEDGIVAEEEWTFTDKTGKVVDAGKSLEFFKKEDGKWLLFRDCYNSDMPAMPMAK